MPPAMTTTAIANAAQNRSSLSSAMKLSLGPNGEGYAASFAIGLAITRVC